VLYPPFKLQIPPVALATDDSPRVQLAPLPHAPLRYLYG